jgi:signal recognition particle receptor subunit alpha
MIENVTILTKGGLVLWENKAYVLSGNPIDSLIKSVLLEDRLAEKSFTIDKYTLKWTMENEFGLIFIVVYQKLIQLLYVEELLEILKQKFTATFNDALKETKKSSTAAASISTTKFDFDNEYVNILKAVEMRDKELKELKKTGSLMKAPKSERMVSDKQKEKEDKEKEEQEKEKEVQQQQQQQEQKGELSKRGSRREMKSFQKKDNKPASSPNKPVKKETKWDDMKYTHAADKQLDRSTTDDGKDDAQVDAFLRKFLPDEAAKTDVDKFDSDDEDFDHSDYVVQQKEAKKGTIGSFFSSLTNGRIIDKEDLQPVMEKFRESLIGKNVNTEIADNICKSVAENLEGKKIGAFTSLASEVDKALDDSMTRILTPKHNIDILREAMVAKEQNRPYVITFCGVNGVGKSTSLSKICFWLKQNGLSCLIAACDTYRSGAVEQLEVHARCLKVNIFNRGYGKDIAIVAKDAIAEAKKKHIDIVLIDTAGRMQDNEPLMKSLTKLIQLNKPDLVLFVGEALVGNDGVDQLTKFNDALTNIAVGENIVNNSNNKTNLIDGIVLTKFDTIDDKVGAAISMVYKTGHPIVFVGVGQTYTDLKKLSIKAVVKALLK